MNLLPSSVADVIEQFGKLPGIGPRTAERYAIQLLKADSNLSKTMAKSLNVLHESVSYCPQTFMLMNASEKVSPLYSDNSRDKKTVAIVEDSLDVIALEKTGQFKGTYHVLGGALSPIDGIGPEQLHIEELRERIVTDDVQELIIATNASVEGESTALFILKAFSDLDLNITRLARGLPAGIDLEYADHITLTRALEGRQAL